MKAREFLDQLNNHHLSKTDTHPSVSCLAYYSIRLQHVNILKEALFLLFFINITCNNLIPHSAISFVSNTEVSTKLKKRISISSNISQHVRSEMLRIQNNRFTDTDNLHRPRASKLPRISRITPEFGTCT